MVSSGVHFSPLASSNKENARCSSGSSCRICPEKLCAGLASNSQRTERLPLRELKLSNKDQNLNAVANCKGKNDGRAPATKKRECFATKSGVNGRAVCRQAQLPKLRMHRDSDNREEPPRSCFSFFLPSRVISSVSRVKKCLEASDPTTKQACGQLGRGPKTMKRDQFCEKASEGIDAIKGKPGNLMERSVSLSRSLKLRRGSESDAALACTPTSTPPPIPSTSPEILYRQSEHEALRLCFGGPLLGDYLGTVHYRRKCKPRGVLTVAEDIRPPGSVDPKINSIVQSPSTPPPAEASVEWMVIDKEERESGTLINWTDQCPTPPLRAGASVEWMASVEQEIEAGAESRFDYLTTGRDQRDGIASEGSRSMIASEVWKSFKATAAAAFPKKQSLWQLKLGGCSHLNSVIWREGLLPRLERLRELGSFNSSLEELITLNANQCCDTVTLNKNLFHSHYAKSCHWAVSHTNSLFEASQGLSRSVQQK